MKACAAAVLRQTLVARSARPEEPCVLLVSSSSQSRDAVLRALCARQVTVADDVKACRLGAHVSESGAVLVDLPSSLSDVAEVTEIATFLRGLRDVNGVVMASAAADSARLVAKAEKDTKLTVNTLSFLAESYSQTRDIPVVLAITGPAELAKAAGLKQQRSTMYQLRLAETNGANVPDVVCVEAPGADVGSQIIDKLRCIGPLPCEPLRGTSQLLHQYRVIRSQLVGQRKPTSPQSAQSSAVQSNDAVITSGLSVPIRKQWTVMVFGKTGAGKSHLANLLVGYKAFDSGDSLASVTGTDSVKQACSSDKSLMVLDTIGFGDTQLPRETVVKSLRDTALEAPGGIDMLLFILKKERVTTSEQETLAYVTQDLFGKDCLPNLYMVITHAGRVAKDVELREPWLKEQIAASVPFASIVQTFGPNPAQRMAFVENPDPAEAEDEEDRSLAERRRLRALADIRSLFENHNVPPFQHGLMNRASEIHAIRLEEMRRELRAKVESDVRRELDRDRGVLEAERKQLHAEVATLKEREEEMQRRFEEEWIRMRSEFERRARELVREDLEPLAKDIVDKTEKKASGRRCNVM